MTMDSDLSSQDKKDLDKFIKFFALKVSALITRITTILRFCAVSMYTRITVNMVVNGVLVYLCIFQTVQVIVQARLGEKISTCSSSSPTGSDWVRYGEDSLLKSVHVITKMISICVLFFLSLMWQ